MATTTRLQEVIQAIQELSPLEQLELIQALSKSVQASYLGRSSAEDFWKPRTLADHIREQQPRPVSDIADLVADFWPEDESADDLVSYIYGQRLEDRQYN
jgi:hypothetical protein